MKIGDPIWLFNVNKRVYPTDERGHPKGGPIWREHWCVYSIIGETRVSWLVGHSGRSAGDAIAKLPKKAFIGGACPPRWATSQEQIDRLEWIEVHRHHVVELVRECRDPEALQRAAAAVGYTPTP